jgi:hypothetical protein
MSIYSKRDPKINGYEFSNVDLFKSKEFVESTTAIVNNLPVDVEVFASTNDIPIPPSADSVSLGYVSGILYAVDSLGNVVAVGPVPVTRYRTQIQVSAGASLSSPNLSVQDGDALPSGVSLNLTSYLRTILVELNGNGILPSPIALISAVPYMNGKCFTNMSSFNNFSLDEVSGFYFNTCTLNGSSLDLADLTAFGFSSLFIIEWYIP